MSKRFPHLTKANSWPGLDTVDPFDLQVTFDPYLWRPDTVIHLCRTPLDSEYRNVGGWATKAERDEWFEEWTSDAVVLDTEIHILPGQSIKLPFAFEVLNQYNYIYIDFPRTPPEGGNPSTVRYFYFLVDVDYRSPSATACTVILDEWTTHMFDIEASYIYLDEGHAPIPAITPSEYFSSPMEHCSLLSVPDVNYGKAARLQAFREHIVNQGPMWLVVSMTSDPMVSPGTIGGNDWRVPTTYGYRNEGAISPAVFAILPEEATNFLEAINASAPQLLPTIQAMFVIPQRYVTINGTFSFLGFTCRTIEPQQVIEDVIQLDESMFIIDTKYAGLTKLYTMPYAWIELVDETGHMQRVAIEETSGKIQVSTIVSILAPFLGIDMQVIGIGIDRNDVPTDTWWDNLSRHDFHYWGEWTRALRHWDIPTFMVLQNSQRTFEWTQYWPREQARTVNQAGYDLALDVNDLNYNLRLSGLGQQSTRLTQQQANGVAQLNLSVTAEGAVAAKQQQRLEDEEYADFVLASTLFDVGLQGVALASSQAQANASMAEISANVGLGSAQSYQDHVSSMGNYQMAGAIVGGAQGVTSGAMGMSGVQYSNPDELDMFLAGDLMPGYTGVGMVPGFNGLGAAAGALGILTSGISSIVNIGSTMQSQTYAETSAQTATTFAQLQLDGAKLHSDQVAATYNLQLSSNQTAFNGTTANMIRKKDIAKDFVSDMLAIRTQLQQDSLQQQQYWQTQISNGDIANARYQAGATKGMADQSALQHKTLQDLSLDIAEKTAKLGSPTIIAQPTGTTYDYTRPKGLWVNVKMQDRGAIAATGDKFLRDGYAMGGMQWEIATWTPMRHFTRWRGELQIGASDVNEITKTIIRSIFRQGTTIWSDPSEIGTISIYDNMP